MNLLVNPTTMVQDGYAPPPLALLYLAAMDPESVVFDAALQGDAHEYIRQTKPKIVGATMYTAGRHETIEILRTAKEAGAITVAGGPHVAVMTSQLAETYPFIDHLVCSDGEEAWARLTRGEKLERVVRLPVRDLDALPTPKFSAVNLAAYAPRGNGIHRGIDIGAVPRISIVLGRGCTGHCDFCSTWWVNGRYRAHGKQWMFKELKQLWDSGVRHLVFQDDCVTANRQAALDLCDMLLQFEFTWFGTTRADCFDAELAVKMKASGCYELTFGIESGSPEILRRMNKETDLECFIDARRICKEAGIIFTALLMFGYPFETEQTKAQSLEFIKRLAPDSFGSVGHVMVLPGTALYRACQEKGLIDDSFWLGPEPYYIYRGGLEG